MIELDLAYKKQIYDENEHRIELQEKLYHYYNGDETEILKYLDTALGKSFKARDIAEFQKDYLNITKKLIQEISVVYIEPPERWIVDKSGNTNEDLTKYLDSVLTGRLNSKDKKIHRYGKLFNTALMEVFFNKVTKKIDFRIDSPHLFTVIPHEDDYQRIGTLLYDKYIGKELFTIVWTDTEHYKLDQNGNKLAIGDNIEMINPYGIIPFAIYRTEEMQDFWGIGKHDIVNTNEIIDVFLTDLANGMIMSTWGTPLYVNCDLSKKADTKDATEQREVSIGPKHPIVIDNVQTDMVPPRIEYISHNDNTTVLIQYIDWRIKLLAANYGLDPNVFLQEAKATSGFSKVMDRINQIEIRNDDIEPAREFEEERFEIIKRVNNYWVDEIEDGKKIDEKLKLKVDFAEINIPKTEDEIWKSREEQEKRYMATPVDWLKEDNPDLTDEEAKQILQDNKEIMDSTVKAEPKTNFQRLLETQNNQVAQTNIGVTP